MMEVRVRAYNVGFGDCFLVTFPDDGTTKNMLIDFGNAPGQRNDRFIEIADHIESTTDGHLDVLVVTHEHLDHIEGFYSTKSVFNTMTIDQVWMSKPSQPGYYTEFTDAQVHQRLKALALDFSASIAARGIDLAPTFQTMLRNNLSNVDRLNYIRGLSTATPLYLRRGNRIQNRGFSDASFTILAPEEDMSVYYKENQQHVSAMADAIDVVAAKNSDWWSFSNAPTVASGTPPNMSDHDWSILKQGIEGGGPEAVRTIDKAQNNTSLVFVMVIGNTRLLFTGDAEIESWEMILDKAAGDLGPVNFMKVSHHGSHNGTVDAILDHMLPVENKANAQVIVSTKSMVYGTTNPVPDKATMTELAKRARVRSTETDPDQLYIEMKVPIT